MTIREIKTRIQEMLKEAYKDVADVKGDATPALLEAQHFMRKQDAEAIKNVCSSRHYFVSFRTAGPDTLQRIAEGHPCKGHKITDKSIKRMKAGHWSYQAPVNPHLGPDENSVFEALRGFVGCPFIPRKADGSVDFQSGDRPPRKYLKPNGDTDYVIYYLNEVYTLPASSNSKTPSACEYAKLEAATIKSDDLVNAYTGDYDMHDLILGGRRPLANTPEELSAMDYLNGALFDKDKVRMKKAALSSKQRYHTSPYALIRHGAQTSFFDYLTTDKGEAELQAKLEENLRAIQTEGYVSMLPYGNMVVKIDDYIAMFDDKGKIYVLNGVGQVYKFYAKKGLIDQIPFYNFFDALHEMPKYRAEIERFAAYINALLSVNCGLIDHTSDYPWRS